MKPFRDKHKTNVEKKTTRLLYCPKNTFRVYVSIRIHNNTTSFEFKVLLKYSKKQSLHRLTEKPLFSNVKLFLPLISS